MSNNNKCVCCGVAFGEAPSGDGEHLCASCYHRFFAWALVHKPEIADDLAKGLPPLSGIKIEWV